MSHSIGKASRSITEKKRVLPLKTKRFKETGQRRHGRTIAVARDDDTANDPLSKQAARAAALEQENARHERQAAETIENTRVAKPVIIAPLAKQAKKAGVVMPQKASRVVGNKKAFIIQDMVALHETKSTTRKRGGPVFAPLTEAEEQALDAQDTIAPTIIP
jgi:hypothetical protein